MHNIANNLDFSFKTKLTGKNSGTKLENYTIFIAYCFRKLYANIFKRKARHCI